MSVTTLDDSSNGLPAVARAFATYSLVPYLGILFCPGAVIAGAVGVVRSFRSPQTVATRSACYFSAMIGVVVLVAQLVLWWMLYQIPVWAVAK